MTDGGAVQATDEFVVARAGQNYKIAGSEIGGSLTPISLTIGPYTVGSVDGATVGVDLGANAVCVLREMTISLTAVNFDGGDPSNGFNVDLSTSFDGSTWSDDGSAAPDRPNVYGQQPAGFISATTPASVKANVTCARYVRLTHTFGGGDQGASASATFHVDLTYF